MTGNFLASRLQIIKRFTAKGWFPLDGCITVTENGSMEGPVLVMFFNHVKHIARRALDNTKALLLFLDGHSLRKHPKWINYSSSSGMEAVINAADTSHIIKLGDQLINKSFQELIRKIREQFFRQGCMDMTKVNFNATREVYVWERITSKIIQASFKATRNFLFQRIFA